jgi:hypothetical protein
MLWMFILHVKLIIHPGLAQKWYYKDNTVSCHHSLCRDTLFLSNNNIVLLWWKVCIYLHDMSPTCSWLFDHIQVGYPIHYLEVPVPDTVKEKWYIGKTDVAGGLCDSNH